MFDKEVKRGATETLLFELFGDGIDQVAQLGISGQGRTIGGNPSQLFFKRASAQIGGVAKSRFIFGPTVSPQMTAEMVTKTMSVRKSVEVELGQVGQRIRVKLAL